MLKRFRLPALICANVLLATSYVKTHACSWCDAMYSSAMQECENEYSGCMTGCFTAYSYQDGNCDDLYPNQDSEWQNCRDEALFEYQNCTNWSCDTNCEDDAGDAHAACYVNCS